MDRPVLVITGSTGLIGSRLCRHLHDKYRIVGVDRDPPRKEDEMDAWISCDLTDDESVREAIARVGREYGKAIESVVHLAAYYDFSGEPSPLYDQLTVQGTRRLLRALQALEVGQFVFSSSLLVMKPVAEGEALDESSPVEAEWSYPESKLAAERVIREERGSIPAVALRIAGVYDEDCHSIPIAQQMRRIYERQLESHFFPGDRDHGQSFVHGEDLVRCIAATVEHRRELDDLEVFLVGEPDVVSYGEMQQILGEAIHGREWTTLWIPAPVAKAGAWVKDKAPGVDSFIKPWMVDLADAHLPVNIDRARTKLGWEPRLRLRKALPEMARRLVADPASWYAANGIEPPGDLGETRGERRGGRRSAARAGRAR